MFGLRLQRDSFAFFTDQLGLLQPTFASDRERMEAVFGKTRFIYLKREDHLDQAISRLRAQQTGLWHQKADVLILCGCHLQSKTFLERLAICQIRSCVRPVRAELKPAGLDGFRKPSPHSRRRTDIVLDKARGVLMSRLTCPPSLHWSCYLLVLLIRFKLFVPRRVHCAPAQPR